MSQSQDANPYIATQVAPPKRSIAEGNWLLTALFAVNFAVALLLAAWCTFQTVIAYDHLARSLWFAILLAAVAYAIGEYDVWRQNDRRGLPMLAKLNLAAGVISLLAIILPCCNIVPDEDELPSTSAVAVRTALVVYLVICGVLRLLCAKSKRSEPDVTPSV
jgi:hypothetical protein